ncbi:hypothetical protein [Clostridium folliculivorans]|uniref:Nitroreductase domain-containing protein n=1 Tax=Clostridium folliculivorans TaxID=2886038 RepID=A0A9W5Y1V5_9CLOT|nr:hypothetical protein [Clostridium folliculivorans]GKU25061.1 hypothetical protein CFOLD11_18870 [Clostridium folliculivorans]GKU31159.1 hypothetical protein CFB3_32660 [Clostridium folliculivorans]
MKYKMMRKVSKVLIVIFLVLIILLLTIFTAGGAFVKEKYLEPWGKSYSDKFEDKRIKLISNGILAASGHNMQPWVIRLDQDKNVFYLYANSDLLTTEVDPFARQTMITQGTFLEYVVVSGEHLGYKVSIDFFPKGQYDEQNLDSSMKEKPVAKVTISESKNKDSKLYDFMFFPDTNREIYKKTNLAKEQEDTLINLSNEDVKITVLDDGNSLKKLGAYAMKGAEIEANIHRMNEESAKVFRVNEYEKNKYRYGYSFEGQNITGLKKYLMQGIITLIASINSEKASSDIYINSTKTAVENTPAYGMVITKNNSRIEQVKSGMIYSSLVLNAHALGLVMQPLSQVLEEYPEMKDQYVNFHKDYANKGETIQMLFRIGKPTKEVPQTMRRDVMDFINK